MHLFKNEIKYFKIVPFSAVQNEFMNGTCFVLVVNNIHVLLCYHWLWNRIHMYVRNNQCS